MNVNDMIKLAVGVVVGVLMLSAILIPVIGEATTTERTFENDHSYYVVKNPETATITWDGTTMKVDNVTVDVPDADENPYGVSIFSVGNGVIRYNTDNTVIKWGNMGSYVSAALTELNLTISGGALSGTFTATGGSATAINLTLEDDYYVLSTSTEAENVLTISDGDLYLNKDTVVQSNGVSKTDNNVVNGVVVFNITGSIEDGFTVKGYNRNGGAELTNITFSNIEVDYTQVSGYVDLYKLSKVTFTTTVTDTNNNDIVVNHSYDYFAAPLEVTSELSVHASAEEIQILEIIPMLVTVGLIVGIVGVAFSRRE